MHCGFLDLEGAKMSKSLGNVVRLRDALGRVDPEGLRLFFLSTHYRNPLSFSEKSLADSETRMEYFYETLRRVDERITGKDFGKGPVHGETGRHLAAFEAAMDDDFNVAGALAAVSAIFGEMNELLEKPPVKDKPLVGRTLQALREDVRKMSVVLGLFDDDASAWLSRRRDRLVGAEGNRSFSRGAAHPAAGRGAEGEELRRGGPHPRRAEGDGRGDHGHARRDDLEGAGVAVFQI